jgi:hypothetical protein
MAFAGRRAWPVVGVAVALFGAIGACIGYPCVGLGVRYGIWLAQCPAGDLRLAAEVHANLVRDVEGTVQIAALALLVPDDRPDTVPVTHALARGASTRLTLLDAQGAEVPGLEVGRWSWGLPSEAKVKLPAVPDGDYRLRVSVDAGFEATAVEVPLPLFAPAVVHVALDRPLYRPGQEVLLRSVALRRTDLAPMDDRPGRWKVWSPSGDLLLDERDAAGSFGVADSSFPLADDAEVGVWRAAYVSGADQDEVTFRVEPFRLPRFRVAVRPSQGWFGRGDAVSVAGDVRYASGAPVANAPVTLQLRAGEGRWPMPLAWEEPFTGRTDGAGRFVLSIGEVPTDLVDRAALVATVTATEAAGEAVVGSASLVLSADPIAVEAVTELPDGLVEQFPNRVYLRVTTPDGTPLDGARLRVQNPWLPDAPAFEADADVDGVAAVTLDPGAPVTVVEPPAPVRIRPRAQQPPVLVSGERRGAGGALELDDRRRLDGLLSSLSLCSGDPQSRETVAVTVQVGASGAVSQVLATGGAPGVASCVEGVHRRMGWGAGSPRTYALRWELPERARPAFAASVEVVAEPNGGGTALSEAVGRAVADANACLGAGIEAGAAVRLHVHAAAGATRATAMVDDLGPLPGSVVGCAARGWTAIPLPSPSPGPVFAVATVSVRTPAPDLAAQPAASTRVGYELRVSATRADVQIGDTRLVLGAGAVPPLRVRATPSLVAPGDAVEVTLLRGPGFSGTLPEEVRLWEGTREVAKAPLDPKSRTATLVVPPEVDGFLRVEEGGARAVVFARRSDPLQVALTPDRTSYRPGETAQLAVTTTAGAGPVAAGVGLIGVDASLGQLAPLLGPDDFGRVTVRATSDAPAFGRFDPRMLALGQIAGPHAAAAAVLRISQIPLDPAGDQWIHAEGRADPDVSTAVMEGFWRAFDQVVQRERAWEAAEPEAMLEPAVMARLWGEALTAAEAEGGPVVDGFGRPLTLSRLPPDLLAQLDPRRLASSGARLSEDTVDWATWVRTEVK